MMAQRVAIKEIQELAGLARILRRFSPHCLQARYDEEADVLYVKFAPSKPIHQSKLTKDDYLIEYDVDGQVVGVTILDASRR
jgi:uncharacterized protein YuzE